MAMSDPSSDPPWDLMGAPRDGGALPGWLASEIYELRRRQEEDHAALARLAARCDGLPPPTSQPGVAPAATQAPVVPPPPCLLCDWLGGNSPSSLYRLDPTAGRATRIGAVGEWTVLDLLGLDPPRGILYGLGARENRTHLLRIDPTTGTVVETVALPRWVNALAARGDEIFGVGGDVILRIVPPGPTAGAGRCEEAPLRGGPRRLMGPLVFSSPDEALVTVEASDGLWLAALSLREPGARLIGPVGRARVNSIALVRGRVFTASTEGQIIEIDPRSGHGRLILTTDPARPWGAITGWI